MTEGSSRYSDLPVDAVDETTVSANDLNLLQRYRAGRLDDAARDTLEARLVSEPSLRRELQLDDAMRDGLAHLESRGNLARLLAEPYRASVRTLAVAASIAALAFGITSLFLWRELTHERQEVARTRTLPAPTIHGDSSTEGSVARLYVTNIRSAGGRPDFTWKRSAGVGTVMLSLETGLDPAGAYAVSIERVVADRPAPLVELPRTTTDAHGIVVLSLTSALLTPGDYSISVHAAGVASDDTEPVVFHLRVTD